MNVDLLQLPHLVLVTGDVGLKSFSLKSRESVEVVLGFHGQREIHVIVELLVEDAADDIHRLRLDLDQLDLFHLEGIPHNFLQLAKHVDGGIDGDLSTLSSASALPGVGPPSQPSAVKPPLAEGARFVVVIMKIPLKQKTPQLTKKKKWSKFNIVQKTKLR